MIEFKEITRENFNSVIKLTVFDEQKDFVADNCYSLAQAKAQPECVPLAICNDDELVGFIMYCMDVKDKEYWIYRLMIDKKHQKKGYGRSAMQKIISLLQQDKEHSKVYISFEPKNDVAKNLYESLGFISDDRIVDGEYVYCRHFAV